MNEIVLPRELLARALNGDPRVVRYFEEQAAVVGEVAALTTSTLTATGAIQDATIISLSPNGSFNNERVLQVGNGLEMEVTDTNVILRASRSAVMVNGGFALTLTVQGDSALAAPLTGILATRDNVETLKGKTLVTPLLSGLGNYVTDAAAATGGVPIGGVYHSAGALRIRLV
jgi:hypothetical protein